MAKRKMEQCQSMSEVKSFKVVSGLIEEAYSFQWKIEKFVVIKSSWDLIRRQSFEFDAGGDHGCLTKWRCHLSADFRRQNIDISLTMVENPTESWPVVTYSFNALKANGEVGKTTQGDSKLFFREAPTAYHPIFLPLATEELVNFLRDDGSLVIEMHFKLYISKKAVLTKCVTELNIQKEVDDFEKAEQDILNRMLNFSDKPKLGETIQILANDEQEFYANKAILASRSPVFRAMFERGNWSEGQLSSGEGGPESSLVLEDLSGKTVKVFLHYLYVGVLLEEEWMAEDVILQLTYAAKKYQLENLSEFLDKVLPDLEFTNFEVLAKLTLLTKRLDMKNAEKGLFAKLKKTAMDIDQLLLDKGESLLE